MPADLSWIASAGIPVPALEAFLLVLARVGGALAFVPLPGFRTAPTIPKVVLALTLTLLLAPAWQGLSLPDAGFTASGASYLRCLLLEAAFGISAGVVVAWLNEAFVVAMQVLGMQAGYAYASMIDPTTQADSGMLPVLTQLGSMMLFFATGADREVIRVFGASLSSIPPGSFRLEETTAQMVIHQTAAMLTLAVRLALPLVALLLLIDVALALLGRLNTQLQLLSLAFPIKMLVSLAVLATLTALFPALYRQASQSATACLWRLAGTQP